MKLSPSMSKWKNVHGNVLCVPETLGSEFKVHGTMYRNNILIYVQQDATLHSLFYLETALHFSGSTITHHQERKQLYLQHLVFVTPLLLSAAIVEELEPVWVCCGWRTPLTVRSNRPMAITVWQIPDAVDRVVCPPSDVWWYHPKYVQQFPDQINCVTLHPFGYILEYGSEITQNKTRLKCIIL